MTIPRTMLCGLIAVFAFASWTTPALACRPAKQTLSSPFSFLGFDPGIPLMTFPLPCPEDIISSTSPGGRQESAAQNRVTRFVATTEDNLRQDIARGQGEYLSSLATLLDVPIADQPAFGAALQSASATNDMGSATPEDLAQALQDLVRH